MSRSRMWNDHLPRTRRAGLWTLATVLAALGCDDAPAPRRPARPPAPAAPAQPAAAARTLETEAVDVPALLESMRKSGKRGTVVNVWASWCGPCRAEVPMLLSLREALGTQLEFVFVSADEPPDFPKAVEAMRSWSGPLPVRVIPGPMTPFKRAMHPDWKGAIPATFLFDETARRRHFWEGPILEHEISPTLQAYLAGETIDGETRPPLAGPE